MPSKRGNGQGTAIKRGKTWTAIWTIGLAVEDGKLRQVRKSKGGFRTKTEALAYAANPSPDAEPAPVRSLQYYWAVWSAGDMAKMSESKQTAFRIARRRLDDIAFRPIGDLTIKDLQETVDAKTSTHYPAKDMRTLLSHLYKRAVAEGQARTNLAEFVSIPPLEEESPIPFTENDLHRLWEAYGAGDHMVGFILLMIYTGMMPGELRRLKVDMVDLERREIVGCGLKTKKRKGTPIVFPELLAPVVLDLCQRTTSRKGYVLNMNEDNFYKNYHAALEQAGVQDLPPYSCRHTTATALALGNIAPSVIQEVMRHTKFSTTQRYIHPDTAAARAAVNTMGKGKEGL